MLCTCLGSTRFDAIRISNIAQHPECLHARCLSNFFEYLTSDVSRTAEFTWNDFIVDIFNYKDDVSYYAGFELCHNKKHIILHIPQKSNDNGLICDHFPIRRQTRGPRKLQCCLCDYIVHEKCEHVLLAERLGSSELTEVQEKATQNKAWEIAALTLNEGLSHLPLAPVSCLSAIRAD